MGSIQTLYKDSLIQGRLAEGSLEVDPLTGDLFSHTKTRHGKKLKGRILDTGYRQYGLKFGSETKHVLGHRVVWLAVNGLIPPGLEIDHINRIKHDNRLSNLRLLSKSANAHNRPGFEGLADRPFKLTPEQVGEIRELKRQGVPCKTIASRFGVCHQHISRIARGTRW